MSTKRTRQGDTKSPAPPGQAYTPRTPVQEAAARAAAGEEEVTPLGGLPLVALALQPPASQGPLDLDDGDLVMYKGKTLGEPITYVPPGRR